MVRRSLVESRILHVCISQKIITSYLFYIFQGQGLKICPHANTNKAREPYIQATREALKSRLQELQHRTISAQQALFEKTLSLYRAYRVYGCLGPKSDEITTLEALQDNTISTAEGEWQAQL